MRNTESNPTLSQTARKDGPPGEFIQSIALTDFIELTHNYRMSDWVKILISALAGVAVGVLLEPLKHTIAMFISKRMVRKAIYRELGKSYMIFCVVGAKLKTEDDGWHSHMITYLSTDAFDHYYAQKRDAFYGIKEWGILVGIYRLLRRIQSDFKDKKTDAKRSTELIAAAISERMTLKGIDERRIKKYAKEYQESVRPFVPPPGNKERLIL